MSDIFVCSFLNFLVFQSGTFSRAWAKAKKTPFGARTNGRKTLGFEQNGVFMLGFVWTCKKAKNILIVSFEMVEKRRKHGYFDVKHAKMKRVLRVRSKRYCECRWRWFSHTFWSLPLPEKINHTMTKQMLPAIEVPPENSTDWQACHRMDPRSGEHGHMELVTSKKYISVWIWVRSPARWKHV